MNSKNIVNCTIINTIVLPRHFEKSFKIITATCLTDPNFFILIIILLLTVLFREFVLLKRSENYAQHVLMTKINRFRTR